MGRDKDIIKKSKHLAFLLRHDSEALERGKIDRHKLVPADSRSIPELQMIIT